MALWSYLGTVGDITGSASFTAVLDLGCRWYHPAVIRVAGIRPRSIGPFREALPDGTRVVAIAEHIHGGAPIRAHVLLADGTNLAAQLAGRRAGPAPQATYGAGFDRVWRYPATVVKPTDGDTITCSLDMGVPTRYTTGVRVAHINSAETGTPEGDQASAYAQVALRPGTAVTVTSRRLEKYGRVLGDITTPEGHDYGAALIAAGHADPYEGARR